MRPPDARTRQTRIRNRQQHLHTAGGREWQASVKYRFFEVGAGGWSSFARNQRLGPPQLTFVKVCPERVSLATV
jgi:hypothetical protein